MDPAEFSTDHAMTPEQRLHALEKIVSIQATHHEHLANQIADLTVAMHDLRREIPSMMAQGLALAVGDPAVWASARKAMHDQARGAAGGVVLRALKTMWDKVLWLLLLLSLIWALRGPDVLLDIVRGVWRGPG
jgi:uncharacterized coiled-coil protein SlyX